MTAREFKEVQEGLRSPFGKWLFAYLKTEADSYRVNGSLMIPTNLGETNEREHTLARANTLADLVDRIPNAIDEQYKQLKQEEHERE